MAAETLRTTSFEDDTGVLVVRVRSSDGSALPERTLAGFTLPGGGTRLKPVADGSVRFPDAPVGRLEVTAEAEGFAPTEASVVVLAGVPAEAVVVLTPRAAPK
jgi:hypothetical protein